MSRSAPVCVVVGVFALCWLGITPPAEAQTRWTGKVVGVYDADTLLVRKGHGSVLIRLHGVDAPEWEQRYGRTAANWVAQQLLYETVEVVALERDRYQRYVALITMPNGELLNTALLDRGYAWVYSSFISWAEYDAWMPRVRAARAARRGLWRDDDPTPPWVWRRYH